MPVRFRQGAFVGIYPTKKEKKGKGGAMENPVKIIRHSKAVKFDDGVETNVQCMGGTMEEVRERAEQIAKENGVEVEIII